MRKFGPFEEHIRDAIALNRFRAPIYAKATNGRSDAVFRSFIAGQHLVLPIARWFDWRARDYERRGVPVLASVFESMSKVPAMAMSPGESHDDDGWNPNATLIRRDIRQEFVSAGFHGAGLTACHHLGYLAERPWRDCMLRHQLESIHRLCNVTPKNIQLALEIGMRSPERLLTSLLHVHLWGVVTARTLDKPALRLQLSGIPILAKDLPVVPPWPDPEGLE